MLSDGLHGHVTCRTMHGRYLSSWTAHHVCWGEVFCKRFEVDEMVSKQSSLVGKAVDQQSGT